MSFLSRAGSFSRHFSTALVCTASFTWLEEGSILEWLVRGGERGRERNEGGGRSERNEERGRGEFACVPCPFTKIGATFNKVTLTWLIGLMYSSLLTATSTTTERIIKW